MEITHHKPLNQCNFIQNLCKRVTDIHNEVIGHENLVPKCEICSENTNEYSFIKNQLFLIVKINFRLKDERILIEEQPIYTLESKDVLNSGSLDFVKEEDAENSNEDSTHFSSNFVGVDDYVDNTECSSKHKGINKLPTRPDPWNIKPSEKKRIENEAAKLYECALCKVKVSRKCHVALHMKTHLRKHGKNSKKRVKNSSNSSTFLEGKQKCPFCHRVYKKRHECRLVEPKVSNIFSCAYCPEAFSTYPKMYLHHKTNHPEQPKPLSPFQCDVCGTFALRLTALRRHMKTHTGETPFTCSVCQKGFRTRPQLVEHQRKHIPKSERDDKYKCEVCQKKFAFRQSLKKHNLLQHTDNRKFYPCTICGGKFISETSLQKHRATHDGKAPRAHKCEECGRIFDKIKYLNQHRKIQHNIFTDLMLNPKPKKQKE
ncbi:zinc finger protein 267-like [Phlebotomus papatasi]|uniref:zinc finger protein 267-like n=1 Tax=Phlebotomus papatasi TaxID=29031 RepID=UPI00248394B5|nr:zinc finger protein 267-like [Phlebotomus papatasi]